jgi:hypothetical protein
MRGLILVFVLLLAGWSQGTKQSETLTVSGHDGDIPIVIVSGKAYVGVQDLARITGGSLSVEANGMTLTLAPAEKKGYSTDFLKAAIEEMAAIREWRVAVMQAVEHSYPFTGEWFEGYRRTAVSKLALVSAAAGTDADKSCAPLVSGELGKMQQFNDQYVATRTTLSYVSPDTVDNDPLGQQILNCARGLESLSAEGEFEDIAACH